MAVYRSAMGKPVDMSSLSTKNEKIRAVGNMNVNARGDILDSNNRVIKDNTKRVKGSYSKTVTPQQAQPSVPRNQLSKEEQMFEDDDDDIIK